MTHQSEFSLSQDQINVIRELSAKSARILAFPAGRIISARTCDAAYVPGAFELTFCTKTGGILSKTIKLVEGSIASDGSDCRMTGGVARRVKFETLQECADAIMAMKSDCALTLGTMRPGLPAKSPIATKAKLTAQEIARSLDYFGYENQPGLILLDHDTHGMTTETKKKLASLNGFIGAATSLCPSIETAGYLHRLSTSAGLYNAKTGEDYRAGDGQHVYLHVADVSDAKRFLDTLQKRAWLAGMGWIVVGEIGQFLVRSIVDTSVSSPERLVFEGAAILKKPLAQHPREVTVHDGVVTDTSRLLDLTPAEEARYQSILMTAKLAAKPEAEARRMIWIESAAGKKFVDNYVARGASPEEAKCAAATGMERGELLADFVIRSDKFGLVTVAEILANRAKFIGDKLRDPFDPNGPSNRAFVMRDGTAIRSSVTSTIYQLKDPEGDAQRAKAAHERSLSGLNFDLAGEMGIDPEPASLPVTFNILNVIQLSTDLDADLKACEQALINSPVEIFQRGGFIVRRSFITGKSHDGSDVTDTHVARHTSETLRIALAEAAKFERYDERKKDMVRKHPPIEYAGLLLKHPDKHYPPLRGIVNTPVLRADGTLISVPGYDKATGLYFDPLGVEFGVIPLKPTRKQAEAALNDLKALFEKFPFVDEASRSVALARCLTPFVRPSLKCAPMFAATAPAARTGKSKLTDIASAITTGHEASVIGATETAEELDKQLSAILLSGATSITLDNLNANFSLKSSLLCQILTQEIVEIRPFGKNDELITVPSISVVSVNGNNLRVVDDLTERTLLCRLDANMELPGTRSFDFDPIEMVKDDRAKYVRACLTILRAYAVAGYPDNAKPVMGGFDDWSNRVRSALVWLGCDDPCATMQQLRDQDEGKGVLDELLGVWRREFGDDYWTIGHAIDHAKGTEIDGVWRKPVTDLLDALSGLCPANRLNPRLVSRWFGNVKGVVVNGRRFVSYQCKNSNDAKRWCVEVIDAPEPRF